MIAEHGLSKFTRLSLTRDKRSRQNTTNAVCMCGVKFLASGPPERSQVEINRAHTRHVRWATGESGMALEDVAEQVREDNNPYRVPTDLSRGVS